MEATPGAEVLFFHLRVIGEHHTILIDMRTGIRCPQRPPVGVPQYAGYVTIF
jgi:hypothetical protein